MKCIYCNKQTEPSHRIIMNDNKEFFCCSKVCEERALAFSDYTNRNKAIFILGVAVIPLILGICSLISGAMGNDILFSTMLALVFLSAGVSIFKFPFLTPISMEKMGIEKSIHTGKNIGIIMMTGALLVWVTYFLV